MMPKKPSAMVDGERGSSLIEVMVALMIMLFLMIGVLQLFSMASLVSMGAGARTEMTSKAQQVVENMRYLQYLTKPIPTGLGQAIPTGLGSTGFTFPIAAATSGTLDPTANAYWGPTGANVFPTSGSNNTPYEISYTIQDGSPSGIFWLVTITVEPTSVSGARRYLGEAITHKRVDYVAQIPK
jgi:type II secretory pathway pseudopilin PulG